MNYVPLILRCFDELPSSSLCIFRASSLHLWCIALGRCKKGCKGDAQYLMRWWTQSQRLMITEGSFLMQKGSLKADDHPRALHQRCIRFIFDAKGLFKGWCISDDHLCIRFKGLVYQTPFDSGGLAVGRLLMLLSSMELMIEENDRLCSSKESPNC